MRPLLLIPIVLALAGCGTKTPLIMPPAPLKTSLAGMPTPDAAARYDHSNAPRLTQ
jgi:predicted small lipoprotein YifL